MTGDFFMRAASRAKPTMSVLSVVLLENVKAGCYTERKRNGAEEI